MNIELNDDFESILVCAERYSCGRMTYMPSVVVDFITPLLSQISTKTLVVFKRDIEGAGYYGSESIDKPLWMSFLKSVNDELRERDNIDGCC